MHKAHNSDRMRSKSVIEEQQELIKEMSEYLNFIREYAEYVLYKKVNEQEDMQPEQFDTSDTTDTVGLDNADMVDNIEVGKHSRISFMKGGEENEENGMSEEDMDGLLGIELNENENIEIKDKDTRGEQTKDTKSELLDELESELERLLEQKENNEKDSDGNKEITVSDTSSKNKSISGVETGKQVNVEDGNHKEKEEISKDENIEVSRKDVSDKFDKLDRLKNQMDSILQFFNESLKKEYEVLINKYPFLALLEEEEIAKFKSYPVELRQRIVEELDKRAWATREDVINTIIYVLEQAKREEQPFLAYASDVDRKFYHSLSENDKRIVESLAKIYNVNEHNVNEFWQLAREKIRENIKKKRVVMESTKKMMSAQKLKKIYESQMDDGNMTMLKLLLGLDD